MKLNEYINKLVEIMNKEGNLEVKNNSYPQCLVTIELGYMRIPKDKRQTAITFYMEDFDEPKQKGEKVVKV